jgi:hypothetical protein
MLSFLCISRPTSLLASNRASLFFFMVFMFSPNILHRQHSPDADVFNSNPSIFLVLPVGILSKAEVIQTSLNRKCLGRCLREQVPFQPVSIAAWSRASAVFGRSHIGITGSNPARGMDVSVFLCVVLSCAGRGLGAGLIPRPRIPTNCLKDP